MATRFSKLFLLPLWCATVLVAPLSVEADAPRVAQADTASVATRIVELTNQTRQKHGLPPTQPVAYLAAAATGHSKEMMELNYFSHVSPTPGRAQPKMRIQLARGWDSRIGENIYRTKGIPSAEIAERAMAAWIKSPSHYKNLIDPTFNSVGIGIVPKGDEFVITQNFSNQTIVVKELLTTPASGGFGMVFQGRVREGSKEGALFVNNSFKETFQADAGGNFELKTSAPAGAQISVSQKKPGGGNSYAQNLVFPIEAGLR